MRNANRQTRRDFIKTSTTLTLAAGAFGASGLGLAADKAARWPVAIRDTHLKVAGKPNCWTALKALGADGVEVEINEEMLCFSLFHPARKYVLANADGVRTLNDDLTANGAVITAFCMHNRLDERLERELEWTKKLVKAATQLKVSVIRIDVVPRATAVDQFLPFAIKGCKQLCDIAEGTPVRFGIENHGRITNDPQFLEKLFDGVASTRLGLTLDAMNFYWFGHSLNELYGIYEKLAPRTFHTHCKNLRYPDDRKNVRRPMGWEYEKYAAPIYEGDIDYQRVGAILRKANYRGDLCLENECLGHFPKEQQADVLKKEVALLKRLA